MKLSLFKKKTQVPKAIFEKFTDLSAWIDDSGNSLLSSSGYKQYKSREWINESTKPEFTTVVRFRLMKGATYDPFRAIYLLYVPDIARSLKASRVVFSHARLAGYRVSYKIPELAQDSRRVGASGKYDYEMNLVKKDFYINFNRYEFGYYEFWKGINKRHHDWLFKALCEQIVKSDAELKNSADVLKILELHRAERMKYADEFVDLVLDAEDHLAYALTLAKTGDTRAAKKAFGEFSASMANEHPNIDKSHLTIFEDYLKEVSAK